MHDVLILGAGAAGLAAAARLRDDGRDFLVLEARDRAGGRCNSISHDASPVALELGAEFVHGDAEATTELALRAGVGIVDVAGTQWRVRGSRLTRQDDFFERVGRVLSRLPSKGDDIAFGEYLDGLRGGRTLADDRRLANSFVQGFHAADPTRASSIALARGGNPAEDESASRHARTVGGYTRLLEPVLRDAADRIRFGEVVRRVRWQRGHVVVTTDAGEHEARAAIVTLPVGVLQSGDVAFDPMPPAIGRALAGLAMGAVCRVTLLFDRRFWEGDVVPRLPKRATLADLCFLHTPGAAFNIWWTLYPLRTPVIVGWSGGPPAAVLEREGDVEARAVTELAAAFGMTRRRLQSRLVASFHHDWIADPFSRGAYSYAVVGGAGAAARLAKPVEDTLFFAGEATAAANSGTVEGALRSGTRASRRVG